MSIMSQDLIWWITVVDLPMMSALFWLIWRTRKDTELANENLRELLETRTSQMREALAAYKLEVAKSYASISDLRNLENRLVGHLLRIEAKLDKTALKAESLSSR